MDKLFQDHIKKFFYNHPYNSMNPQNEQQEKARLLRGAENQSQHDPDSDSNSAPRSDGIAIEYEQIGGNGTVSPLIESGSTFDIPGETNIGGILRQLEEIHQDYVSYIEAHSARLRARLAEDEERRRDAISKIEKLKQQIVERFEEDLGEGEEE